MPEPTTPAPPTAPEPSTCSCTGTRAGLNACVHCPTPWPDFPGATRITRPEDVAAGIAAAWTVSAIPAGEPANPPCVSVAGLDMDPSDVVGPDLGPAELTAEEARALADELGRDLYEAQDALLFVAECCDVADRTGEPVTTARVRTWLQGAKCGRQIMAERGVSITEVARLACETGDIRTCTTACPEHGDVPASPGFEAAKAASPTPKAPQSGDVPTDLGTQAASPNETGAGVGALCHCGLGTKADCGTKSWGCGPNGDHACGNCEGIDPGSCLMNPGRAATPAPSASRDTMREAITDAIDAVFEQWATGLGETSPQDALAAAVMAVRDGEVEQLRAKVQRLTSDLAETAGLEETAADRYQTALHWQERAEEAEAHVKRLADLADRLGTTEHQQRAVIARVREQCAEWARPIKSGSWDAQIRDDIAASCANMILRALTAPHGPDGQGDGGGK